MPSIGEVARTLFSRKWWWVTLLVIVLMAVMARLGIWQLDRLQERRAANAQLLAAIESAPIDLNDDVDGYTSLHPGEVSSDLANRNVIMAGKFDFANQRILKLQNLSGRAGVHLITPFVLDGTDVAVLVDRGWIPDAEYEAGNAFAEPAGNQTVDGYIALTEIISRRTSDSDVSTGSGIELFRIDIAAIQKGMPHTLLPFYVKVAPPEGGITSLPIPTAKEIDLSEGPHLDYAFQWFIFSIGLGIAYVVYIIRWLKMRNVSPSQTISGTSV
ncbi:MAG: SURF1 family protein [Anaerolineae bacterium]|nr:SURF1 family protein [Anaerolineae bacterium]